MSEEVFTMRAHIKVSAELKVLINNQIKSCTYNTVVGNLYHEVMNVNILKKKKSHYYISFKYQN